MRVSEVNTKRVTGRKAAVAGWLLVWSVVLLLGRAASAQDITNVTVVNITPSSFSVIWATSGFGPPDISIFADPGAMTNLAGQVGIEFYPLHTGNPALTNAYDLRLNQQLLRQRTMAQGLVHVRVSGCSPDTTHYYRLRGIDTNGQPMAWPATGPLPAVTTAQETSFVVQSRQLVFNLPGLDPSGSIVILSNTNTPSLLAAVAGDGAPNNEVFFSVNDLIAATRNTNYLPLGIQEFTASVLNPRSNTISQSYSLTFTTDFLVGQVDQSSLGAYAVLSIGSAVLRAGDLGSLPFDLYASGITNLTFVLNLPTNRLSNLSVQAVSPQLSSASIQPNASNSFLVSFAAAPGQNLAGNQQLAQLNFTAAANQSSGFVPITPQLLHGFNSDGSTVDNFATQAGRLTIVGNEPLLEATLGPDLTRNLTLYGIPGASYQIQLSTNLAQVGNWTDLLRVPMTNLVEVFTGLDNSKAVALYQALQFTASRPILDINSSPGGMVSLVLYGTPLAAYQVDYVPTLNFPLDWTLLREIPLTNSFQMINLVASGSGSGFYRVGTSNAEPPILDGQLANPYRPLLVHGLAGTNYTLQYATNLSTGVIWYPLLNVTLTNSFQ